MCSEYYQNCHLWLPSECCNNFIPDYITTKVGKQFWNLKSCCAEQFKFDKRTPGLFKLEFQGDKILSLCSKSYICVGDNKRKLAHKEVNTNQNNMRFNHYENVWANEATTYEQTKVGLTSIYIKRKVQSDGFTTQPLCL